MMLSAHKKNIDKSKNNCHFCRTYFSNFLHITFVMPYLIQFFQQPLMLSMIFLTLKWKKNYYQDESVAFLNLASKRNERLIDGT